MLNLFHFQKYALTISRQVATKSLTEGRGFSQVGQPLDPKDVDLFTNEQLAQLYELYEETTKPQDEYPV